MTNFSFHLFLQGLISLTQFWGTHSPSGPSDSWAIHLGLWPNHCDSKGCDPSRDYTNIGGLLSDQGTGDTLSFMQTYWTDNHGRNCWEHEWDKHGTCYSPTGAETVAFFQTTVGLLQKYDIYNALSNVGITPSSHRTYSLSELQSALSSAFGVMHSFDCSHGKYLNEANIWFNLQGSVIDGSFNPVDAPSPGHCPEEGIRYAQELMAVVNQRFFGHV
ncbi:base non-specific acid ribonuclease [Amanita rubescens]|nr:base non-specific acid ribonuclease [Amanita rubescens]